MTGTVRFARHQGAYSEEDFHRIRKKTFYRGSTLEDLRRFLVEGVPLSALGRKRQQFLRNKLVDLEYRGLIT